MEYMGLIAATGVIRMHQPGFSVWQGKGRLLLLALLVMLLA